MKPERFIPAPPVSPGDVLREFIFTNGGITQEKLAKAMKVSRFSINQIVNGKRSITAEMALKLAHVTSTTVDLWLNLQRDTDLYNARLKLNGKLDGLRVLRAPKTDSELFLDIDDGDSTGSLADTDNGWLSDVRQCVERIGRTNFTLDDIYHFEKELAKAHPDNHHVREKIRQQLQVLRDEGFLDFIEPGTYRRK
jgi:addiction module HigA family antidote